MVIRHIGLTCKREKEADLFYQDLLGLKKIGQKQVPAELAKKIFGIELPLRILNYADDKIHFELFVNPQNEGDARPRVDHCCLEVPDRNQFLEKCRRLKVETQEIRKDDGARLVFIKDFDGNRFEIK
jgi:catechol 2,3-dioxygenase-like lactoylglutathione lyase family enzyme